MKLFFLSLTVLGFIAVQATAQLSHGKNREVIDEDQGEFDDGAAAPDNGDSDTTADVHLGEVRISGPGCPVGTSSATLSPDKRTISVLFDNFMATAGDGGMPRETRLGCQIVVPVIVRPGYRAVVAQFDYRGFYSLPKAAIVDIQSIFQYSELDGGTIYKRRSIRRRIFTRDGDNDFALSRRAPMVGRWSKCGNSFNLHMTTILKARSNLKLEPTMIALDSADGVLSPIKYHLGWRKCRM